jgi:aryl-alcohol dehydrogenase-like predicted oxidoreductase
MSISSNAFGKTGARVTRLGFGAMELAQVAGGAEEASIDQLLNAVLDSGINLIDTAPDYGASEELVGKFLHARRDEYFLASKCGCLVDRVPGLKDGKLEHDFSPLNVRAGVEQSLRRLRTDRLDLVQVHSSPGRTVLEAAGTVEEMTRLRDEGKVRFLGMSSTLPELEGHLDMGVFDAFQIPYSALQPEHEELIRRASEAGAGTIIRGAVARGATAPDHDEGAKHDYWRNFISARRDLWERADFDGLLREAGDMPRMEFMLRFALSHTGLSTAIVGTSNVGHLQSNIEAASKGPLSVDLVREAKRRVREAID